MTRFGHTIVQHSGYGYKSDPRFERTVESRALESKAEVSRVEKAGGLIFPTYEAAETFCEQANYPPEVQGLLAQVRGSFSALGIDGLAIYIPVPLREVAS